MFDFLSRERKGRFYIKTQRRNREGNMKVEAEIGGMQIKDFLQTAEVKKETWNRFFLSLQKVSTPLIF